MGYHILRRKRGRSQYFSFPRLQNQVETDTQELRPEIAKKPGFFKSVKIIGDRLENMDRNWFWNFLRDTYRKVFKREGDV
jgi:hypothetical protein